MRVQLLGVRGSTPTPGPGFVEVGGNTSCIAVLPSDGDRWLVLDAGTGFHHLAATLGDTALDADVVLTHLHWDHVQGLPFLRQADREDATVDLWIPSPDGSDDAAALERLARGFSPPSFPIRPDQLRGDWTFHALCPGSRWMGRRSVVVAEIEHKGGRTLGVRVSQDDRSFAYLPDHAIAIATPERRLAANGLVEGVDVLFHGAPYVHDELHTALAFGHSTVHDAVDLALENGVGRLVLIHHAPHRTDGQIARVLAEAQERVTQRGAELPVQVGIEGALVPI